MPAPQLTTKLVILFADISNSSALYGEFGDDQARQLIANCLNLLTQLVISHKGAVIKTIGDQIMCTFPDSVTALKAAIAMQNGSSEPRVENEPTISIRIGLHFGEVICEAGDVFGDTVNVAARVTNITRAHQTMLTRAVADLLPTKFRSQVQQIMRAELRGRQETLDIFQVIRADENTTNTRIGIAKSRKPSAARNELLLRYAQQVVSVNNQRKSVLLGRGDSGDLVVLNNFCSRQHARVEFNFGKFVLSDLSSNGTYIRFNDNPEIHLIHQEIILHGAGTISLGQSFSENPHDIIQFILQ